MRGDEEVCANCGTRRGQTTPPTTPANLPPYATNYPTPPRGNRGLILVVIVAAAVLIIGLIAAVIILDNPDNSPEVLPDQPADGVTIDSVNIDDRPMAGVEPQPGNQVVRLSLTMTNHADRPVLMGVDDFQLETADGELYPSSPEASPEIPDTLAPGETATFSVGFEIPEDAQPDTVHFNGSYSTE